MSFLLDTDILLWFLENDSKLSNQVREVIINRENLIVVSAISAWEISIKQSLGKLIAQALVEGLTIITVDQKFKFYDVPLFSDDFG